MFDNLNFYTLTIVKTSQTLLFPNRLHSMRKMHVLAIIFLMAGSVLGIKDSTSTLSRVLAMSKGLQMVTEMTPAVRPDKKLIILVLLIPNQCCSDMLISIIINLYIIIQDVRFLYLWSELRLPRQTRHLQVLKMAPHLMYISLTQHPSPSFLA